MKVYVIQSKNGIMINVCASSNTYMSYKWNPSTYHCECNKACKVNKYLSTKFFSFEKRLFSKLVLAYEDKILNATEN